jgi:hypothetical protein
MSIATDRVMAAFVRTHLPMTPEQAVVVREAIAALMREHSAPVLIEKIAR